MKTGHKRQMTAGILELVLGIGLILYICLAENKEQEDRENEDWA